MIQIRDLCMRLESGGHTVDILKDINMEVPKGQFLTVVGPSGSGKTTLLGLMAGLDAPTSGSVSLNGVCLSDLNEDDLACLRGKTTGFVFQSYQLIPSLTAQENVAVPLELAGENGALDRAEELLASVGLAERCRHYPLHLSGGEQQRVALARAIALHPPILLADEPTGNLDSSTGRMIMDLLVEIHLREANTMVLVTHNPALVSQADRMVTLRDGYLVSDERLRGGP